MYSEGESAAAVRQQIPRVQGIRHQQNINEETMEMLGFLGSLSEKTFYMCASCDTERWGEREANEII